MRTQWDLSLLESSMNRRIADVCFLGPRVSEAAQLSFQSACGRDLISSQEEKEEATPLAFAPLQRTRPPAESIDRWIDGRIGHENGRNQIKIYGGARAGDPGRKDMGPPVASAGGPTA